MVKKERGKQINELIQNTRKTTQPNTRGDPLKLFPYSDNIRLYMFIFS